MSRLEVVPEGGGPMVAGVVTMRFMVASQSVQCVRCLARVQFPGATPPADLRCERCGGEMRRVLPYLVDLSVNAPVGMCACRAGGVNAARWRRLKQEQRDALTPSALERFRCEHVRAARDYLHCALAEVFRSQYDTGP